MALKAADRINVLFRRAWVSRVTPRPAAEPAAVDRRVIAESRAVAAEILAKEANAIRLKTLLDAARDQATARTISLAEERFAAARGEWEAVRRGFDPEPDPYAELEAAQPAAAAEPTTLPRIPLRPQRNGLLLGALIAAVLFGGAGIGVYLKSETIPAAEGGVVASVQDPAIKAPALGGADMIARTGGSGGVVSASMDGGTVAATVSTAPVHAVASAKRKARALLIPPVPPSRPEPESETLAADIPIPVQPPRVIPTVE